MAAKLKRPYWEATTIDASGVENPNQIPADLVFGQSEIQVPKPEMSLLLVSATQWNKDF